MVSNGDTISVWFSCGAASAAAAYETVRKYGDTANIRLLNNPVIEEHEDNRRFLEDVERWLGIEVESVTHPKYPSCSAREVWGHRRYMSGVAGAPCTSILKREARQIWERQNHYDHTVLGFTVDERKRHNNFTLTERPLLPVLIEEGYRKQDCYNLLKRHGIQPPRMYQLGFPNANCVGCVKSGSVTYWNHVRKHFPEVFWDRAEQSRSIGARLVKYKGTRIYLDELPPDAVGAPLKSMEDVGCGSFCEEGSDAP